MTKQQTTPLVSIRPSFRPQIDSLSHSNLQSLTRIVDSSIRTVDSIPSRTNARKHMSIQVDSRAETLTLEQLRQGLPADHPARPDHPQSELATLVPADLIRQIASRAEQESVPVSSLYLASYAILLSRYANTPEVCLYACSRATQTSDLMAAVVRPSCTPDLNVRGF